MRKAFEVIREEFISYEIVVNSDRCWSIFLTMADGHTEERMIWTDTDGKLHYSDY